METIEKRYLAGKFKTRQLSYDPKADGQTGHYASEQRKGKQFGREIPAFMYEAFRGAWLRRVPMERLSTGLTGQAMPNIESLSTDTSYTLHRHRHHQHEQD